MPRDLFTSASSPATKSPQRRWTLVISLIAHGALLLALAALSLGSAWDAPQVVRTLEGYFVVSPPPEPPPPPAPPAANLPPSFMARPDVAPSSAPFTVAPEVERATAPAGMGLDSAPAASVPGGIGTTAALPSDPPPIVKEIPRVGGDIHPPARLVYVPPVYPPLALSARVEGEVVLEAIIDETGAVRTPRVIKSVAMLDRAAIDAVMRWRYSPTRLNGAAVPVIMNITVRFSLH